MFLFDLIFNKKQVILLLIFFTHSCRLLIEFIFHTEKKGSQYSVYTKATSKVIAIVA